MLTNEENTTTSRFPSLQPEMINRISKEAHLRSLPPQEVDWDAIHKLADAALEKEKS